MAADPETPILTADSGLEMEQVNRDKTLGPRKCSPRRL